MENAATRACLFLLGLVAGGPLVGCRSAPSPSAEAGGAATAAPASAASSPAPAPPTDRGARDATASADAGCRCPSLTWSDGPGLGSWRRITVAPDCRVTTETHPNGIETVKCAATLSCDGERGARALAALADAPAVGDALRNKADFGARSAVAVDQRAITVQRNADDHYAVSARCVMTSDCDGAPPAASDLAGFFESGRRATDGGPRPEPPLTAQKCDR